MITVREAEIIIQRLGGKPQFDSHDFILLYLEKFPYSYFSMMRAKDNQVNMVNADIANFLKKHQVSLGIREEAGKVTSLDLYSNPAECALWTIIKDN